MFSLDELFCHVDDFCQKFEAQWHKTLLKHGGIKRVRAKSMCLSEIMTILIAFHKILSKFQAFLFRTCTETMGLCISRTSKLPKICGMDARSACTPMCVSEALF